MRILLSSYAFDPSVGGIETVGRLLAEQWTASGQEVIVVTRTPGPEAGGGKYRVVRNPTWREALRLAVWADVIFQNNLSLALVWPWLFVRRTLFITHHTWLEHNRAWLHPAVVAKKMVLRFARNFAVSELLAVDLPAGTRVVAGPYDDATFNEEGKGVERNADFLFVGRLVPDKGVDVFVQALGLLRDGGREFRATIVGSGPEEPAIRQLVRELGLEEWIALPGQLQGASLAECYRSHRIVVVPSRWREPFGLVALEALACGCGVVAADAGALREAAGSTARYFSNGDAADLARNLQAERASDQSMEQKQRVGEHLKRYRTASVARYYLNCFERR